MMSTGVQVIIALLAILVALMVYVAVRVTRGFRNLTEERLRIYTEHYGNMHRTMRCLRQRVRKGDRFPYSDAGPDAQTLLIGSAAVAKRNVEVLDAFGDIYERIMHDAPETEIKDKIDAAEKQLITLHVAMQRDLALMSGDGRFPRVEVFRRNREVDS